MIRPVLLCALLGLSSLEVEDQDRAAVERALSNYVTAVEEGRPELIEKSVHPDLAKFGFHRETPASDWRRIPMTFEGLVEVASTFKEQGWVPDDAEHSIEIFEVLDQTASAKLTAFWGIDYMHLAKYEGAWKIVHVLWQSPPRPAVAGD